MPDDLAIQLLNECVGMNTDEALAHLKKRQEEMEAERNAEPTDADVEQAVLQAWRDAGSPQSFSVEWTEDGPVIHKESPIPSTWEMIVQFKATNPDMENIPRFEYRNGEWIRK